MNWLIRENGRYPWRLTQTLNGAWLNQWIKENTDLDHACRLMVQLEDFQQARERLQSITRDLGFINLLAHSAIQVGREHEALLKKPHEPFAVYGKKDKEAKSRAGKITAENTKPDTERIISEMNRLVEHHSVKSASEIVHNQLKRSGTEIKSDAIRQRYRYHMKKLKVRSRPPADS